MYRKDEHAHRRKEEPKCMQITHQTKYETQMQLKYIQQQKSQSQNNILTSRLQLVISRGRESTINYVYAFYHSLSHPRINHALRNST